MKKHIVSAFYSSLIMSVIITIMTFIIPRIIYPNYFSANLWNGFLISLIGFAIVFVIGFFGFLISGIVQERKHNKEFHHGRRPTKRPRKR